MHAILITSELQEKLNELHLQSDTMRHDVEVLENLVAEIVAKNKIKKERGK